MNTESTKKAAFEQDNRKSTELSDFLHRQQGQPYDRNSDLGHKAELIGVPYRIADDGTKHYQVETVEQLRALIGEAENESDWFWDEFASSLVALILVFAGVVLWKVWVG